MTTRIISALLLALLGCAPAVLAQSVPLRVLHAEPFDARPVQAPGAQKPTSETLRLQAFGRSFELVLEDNSALLRSASPRARQELASMQVLKGTLKNVPDSWVRLTLRDGSYSGAIWDGTELYGISPLDVLEPMLLAPMSRRAGGSGIYRLTDTQGGLLDKSCAVVTGGASQRNPLAKYRALLGELRSMRILDPALREIEVALISDFEHTSARGARTVSSMIDKMNIVDGIFNPQVGVSTVPTDFITFASNTDPFTVSSATSLIFELSEYRNSTPAIRNRGLAHLITGRQLFGNAVGVAFLGSLCSPNFGVSLSESSAAVDSALIIAHELGHNFGAAHDGEAGSVCVSTPTNFIMSPFLSSSTTFSSCSVQSMQPHIAAASCVVPSRNRDVALSAPTNEIWARVGQPFEYVLDVASVGDTIASNVVVSVDISFDGPGTPPQMQSISFPDGTCTTDFRPINCYLSGLAAGQSRRLTIGLLDTSRRLIAFTATASTTNDSNPNNDGSLVRAFVAAERDFRITIAPQPLVVPSGQPFEITFDIEAAGTQAITNATAEISPFTNFTVLSATAEDGTCTVTANPLATCTIASIPVGTPRRVRLQLTSTGVRDDDTAGLIRVRDTALGGVERSKEFRLTIVAARDVSVASPPPHVRRVAIGTDALWPVQVRSNGVQDVNDVVVRLSTMPNVTLSVDGPIGASCSAPGNTIDCNIGTMPAGALQTLQVRARAAFETSTTVVAQIMLPVLDEVQANDQLLLSLDVRVASQIALQVPSSALSFDGRLGVLVGTVSAVGANASTDVVATATLHPSFTIQSASLGLTACTLAQATPHVATCTATQLPAGVDQPLVVRYVAPEPGTYNGSVNVTASNDTFPSNNTRPVTFGVSPSIDGRLLPPASARGRTDQPLDLSFTLTTGRYVLPDARIEFRWPSQVAEFTVIAPSVTCTGNSFAFSCPLGTIAANSTVPITVRVRASVSVLIIANLIASADTDPSNNVASVVIPIFNPGDIGISFAQSSVTATVGQRFELPRIDLQILASVQEAFVEFEFDRTMLQNPMTASGPCIWTTFPARCDLGSSLTPGTLERVYSFVPQAAGQFPVTVRVGALNDFNSANDVQTMTINVQAAAPPPPPPPPPSSGGGSGGGGGGNIGWLMTALLLLLLRSTIRSVPSPTEHTHGRASRSR